MTRKLAIAFVVVFVFAGLSMKVLAQQKERAVASTNTSFEARVEAEPKRQKQYKTIYRQDSYGAFLGNKCVEDHTRKMGFKYELVPRQGPGSKTATGIFLHNSAAKFLLMFKNGPFWGVRLRKKIDECRLKTGDYIG